MKEVAVKKSEFSLPEGIPEEIKDEILASRTRLSCSIEVSQDGVINARYSYSKDDDYANFEKNHKTWEEFQTFCQKFFSIQNYHDNYQKKKKG